MSVFNDYLDESIQRKMIVEVVDEHIKVSCGIMKPIGTCGSAFYSVDDMLTNDGCNTSDQTNVVNNCRLYKNWRSVFDGKGSIPVRIFLNEAYTTDIRYNQPLTDYSTCGSILNFEDAYNSDCQKLKTLPNTIDSYRGGVESVDCQEITGWALDGKYIKNILIADFYLDEIKIRTTQANLGNAPEWEKDYKDYFCSFRYVLPYATRFKSSLWHMFQVRFGGKIEILKPSTEAEKRSFVRVIVRGFVNLNSAWVSHRIRCQTFFRRGENMKLRYAQI